MSRAVVGEFATAEALLAALAKARQQHRPVLDAFSPYPLTEAAQELAPDWAQVRWWAAAGALGMALVALAVQYLSNTRFLPINTGGRPLNSWPVYVMTTFEVCVLAGTVVGCAVFLFKARLPQLVHPAFEIPGFDRASQDRFFLALQAPERDQPAEMALVEFLMGEGALRAEGAEL